MWEYGHHYHVERVCVKKRSFDCGVMVDFKQSSRSSSKDKNIVEGNLQYVGKIKEIIELDYRSFKCCIFKCKWYEAFERTRRHDAHCGLFSIDSSKYLLEDKEPYVLPIHCEQVFFSQNNNINIRSISRQYFDNSLPIGNIYVFNDKNKNVIIYV